MKNRCKKILTFIIIGACLVGCGSSNSKEDRQAMNLEKLGEISVCVREEESGTRQAFTELVADSETILKDCHEANGNDDVVEYVGENKNAIGYISKDTSLEKSECHLVDSGEKFVRPFNIVYIGELSDVENDFLRYLKSAAKEEESFLSDKSQGVIKVGGSSSMANMIQEYADEYMRLNSNATVAVVATDSGDGVNGTLSGEYNLGMVSRTLTDYEQELLQTEKLTENEIVIIVNNENPITYLSKQEIEDIYEGKTTYWKSLKEDK